MTAVILVFPATTSQPGPVAVTAQSTSPRPLGALDTWRCPVVVSNHHHDHSFEYYCFGGGSAYWQKQNENNERCVVSSDHSQQDLAPRSVNKNGRVPKMHPPFPTLIRPPLYHIATTIELWFDDLWNDKSIGHH
jgi:hypothetical protein